MQIRVRSSGRIIAENRARLHLEQRLNHVVVPGRSNILPDARENVLDSAVGV